MWIHPLIDFEKQCKKLKKRALIDHFMARILQLIDFGFLFANHKI